MKILKTFEAAKGDKVAYRQPSYVGVHLADVVQFGIGFVVVRYGKDGSGNIYEEELAIIFETLEEAEAVASDFSALL